MKTLLDREKLAGILTATDLETVMFFYPFRNVKNENIAQSIKPYTDTLYVHQLDDVISRSNNWQMAKKPKNEIQAGRVIRAHAWGDAFTEPSQYVKPAGSSAVS